MARQVQDTAAAEGLPAVQLTLDNSYEYTSRGCDDTAQSLRRLLCSHLGSELRQLRLGF